MPLHLHLSSLQEDPERKRGGERREREEGREEERAINGSSKRKPETEEGRLRKQRDTYIPI